MCLFVRSDFFLRSVSFNTNGLTWINLSDNNIVPPHQDAAVIRGGANNRTLFLYGGKSLLSAKVMALVYTFNTQSNLWEIQETTVGVPPTEKVSITPVIDNNGLFVRRSHLYKVIFRINF